MLFGWKRKTSASGSGEESANFAGRGHAPHLHLRRNAVRCFACLQRSGALVLGHGGIATSQRSVL